MASGVPETLLDSASKQYPTNSKRGEVLLCLEGGERWVSGSWVEEFWVCGRKC